MKDYIPTLQEVAAANKRLTDYTNTTFEVDKIGRAHV